MPSILRTLLSAASVMLVLAACSGEPLAALPSEAGLEPLAAGAQAGQPVPDRYIVVFREGVTNGRALAAQMVQAAGGQLHFSYEHALNGFAATLPPQAIDGITRNPHVAYVEQDSVVTIVQTTQSDATWGLDRIDQRELPLDTRYTYTPTGSGVRAYIIDTGILLGHSEFTGRLLSGYDAFDEDGNANDCHGHGTHVAGTVGGTVYGVAKAVTLVPVRVLNCNGSGTTSGVIAGVDWVTGEKKNNQSIPMVANMSLGGGASSALDTAVANSVRAGVVQVVAAGNGNRGGREDDACKYSPAREPLALTISATSNTDTKASWANYGTCVDLFAPGVGITSAWYTGASDTRKISGTSMAAPHVAGGVALYLSENTDATPAQVEAAIESNATADVVKSAGSGSPNLLLYTGDDTATPPPNTAPTADFTFSCTDLSCSFADTSTVSDGTIDSWSWDFGDGTSSIAQNPEHDYSEANTYLVWLTVTDDQGESASVSKSVSVTSGGGDTDVTAPIIVSWSTTDTSAGPWTRYDVSWSVADETALASVVVEALDGNEVVNTVTTSVSGTSASGVSSVRNRGPITSIRLTVVDAAGNEASATRSF